MAARTNKSQINLLPQEEFASTTLGRVLTWLLSSFRIIVIVTEMVVMLAFLSRFWLDARSNDLNDAIKQKTAVLGATSDFEKEFRETQKKLKIFSTLTQADAPVSSLFGKIISYMPPDVFLSSFSFAENSAQIKGFGGSERNIAQFMANLDGSKLFKDVSLLNISSDTENKNVIVFVIRLVSKSGGGK